MDLGTDAPAPMELSPTKASPITFAPKGHLNAGPVKAMGMLPPISQLASTWMEGQLTPCDIWKAHDVV